MDKLELYGSLKGIDFDTFKKLYFGDREVPYGTVNSFYEDFLCSGKDLQTYIKETTKEVY